MVIAAVACVAAFLAVAGVNHDTSDEFESWKRQFGITYAIEENSYRKGVFHLNTERINRHNGLLGRSYEMGVNQFTGLTTEEFKELHLMTPLEFKSDEVEAPRQTVTGPTIDWQTSGKVTRVRNQGACSAGYAFSAVGAVESLSGIFFSSLQEFSAQQIVDCSSTYGNNGCSDGSAYNTFGFIKDRGISTEAGYPWVNATR